MDKDIIYIDPADDITDIISKIKEAKEKAVALVPPKKSSVLHSSVNFKLIAKTAQTNKKDISLITTDDSLKHLAANTNIPVASNPKATAEVPELDDVFAKVEPVSKTIEAPEDVEDAPTPEEEKPSKKTDKTTKSDEKTVQPKDLNSTSPRREKAKEKKDKKSPLIPSFDKYRKWVILGVLAGLALIAFLVWALVFAPGVTIEAKVRTTSHNLAKNVTFTTDEKAAKPEEGVFLMKEETQTVKGETEFTATGEKDNGKKAEYTLSVTREKTGVVNSGQTIKTLSISSGSTLTYNGLNFKISNGISFPGFEANASNCDSMGTRTDGTKYFEGCHVSGGSGSITVVASEAGEKYNSATNVSGWSHSGYTVNSVSQKVSGTTEVVKIVTDQDIKNAESSIDLDADTDKIEKELYQKFDDDSFIIDNSFGVSDQKVTSSPALGQEVNGDTKPKLKIEATYHVLAVSRKDLDAYIKTQITQDELKDKKDQKIYATGVEKRAGTKKDRKNSKDKVYFQSIEKTDAGYTARLKTIVETGPKVEEKKILERVAGKKIGVARAEIQEIEGIVDVKVKSNFFWVNSVPNDTSRVKIKISIKED